MFSINDLTYLDYTCLQEDMNTCGTFEIVSAAVGLFAAFAGYIRWGVNPEDFVPSFVDMEDDEGSVCLFEVNRSAVKQEPLSVLLTLKERLHSGEKLSIRFEGEEGVDAGGLTSEFFCIFMKSLQKESSLGFFQYSKEELQEYGFSRRSFYQTVLGDVFNYISERETFEVEELVDPDFIKKVLSIEVDKWRLAFDQFAATKKYDERLMLELFFLLNGEEKQGMQSFYNKCIDFFQGRISAQDIEEEIEQVEGESCATGLEEKALQYLKDNFQDQAENIFHFMEALTFSKSGPFEPMQYEGIRQKALAGNIFPGVQGSYDKDKVAQSLVLSDAVQGEVRIALQQKVDQLKRTIVTIATPVEVKLFTRFITGNTILAEGQVIKVGECKEAWKYLTADTCFDFFNLYVPTRAGVDETDEGLLRSVISRMSNLEFYRG